MLAAAFAGTLFHTLISLSVVCHINPPLLCSLIEIFRPSKVAASEIFASIIMPDANYKKAEPKIPMTSDASMQTIR
jgi:hypothetical protein